MMLWSWTTQARQRSYDRVIRLDFDRKGFDDVYEEIDLALIPLMLAFTFCYTKMFKPKLRENISIHDWPILIKHALMYVTYRVLQSGSARYSIKIFDGFPMSHSVSKANHDGMLTCCPRTTPKARISPT